MTYTTANIETAMCLWEAYVDGTLSEDAKAKAEAYRQERGTPQLRHAIMSAIEPCEKAWEAGRDTDTECEPYDWEHCPHFLSRWIIDNLA